jgi:hypothetical protein
VFSKYCFSSIITSFVKKELSTDMTVGQFFKKRSL